MPARQKRSIPLQLPPPLKLAAGRACGRHFPWLRGANYCTHSSPEKDQNSVEATLLVHRPRVSPPHQEALEQVWVSPNTPYPRPLPDLPPVPVPDPAQRELVAKQLTLGAAALAILWAITRSTPVGRAIVA